MVHHGIEVTQTLEMIKNNVRSDSAIGKEAQGKYALKRLMFWKVAQWVLFVGGLWMGWTFFKWLIF